MRRFRGHTHRFHILLWLLAAGCLAQVRAQVSPRSITVEVSTVAQAVAGRTGVGAPVDRVTLTHQVSYADLDLTTRAGETELHRRIAETARFACEQIERLYPAQTESLARCTRGAIEDASSQVTAAIDSAEREARGE
jgi:UrcA family protein